MIPFSPTVAALLAAAGEIVPSTLAGRIALLDRRAAIERAAAAKALREHKPGWRVTRTFHLTRSRYLEQEAVRLRAILARQSRPAPSIFRPRPPLVTPSSFRPPRPGYRPPPPAYYAPPAPPSVRPAPLFAPGVYGPSAETEEAAPAVMEPSTIAQQENASAMPDVGPWYTRPLGVGALVFGGVVAVIALRKKGKKSKADKAAS